MNSRTIRTSPAALPLVLTTATALTAPTASAACDIGAYEHTS